MNYIKKTTICLILVLCMAVSLLPITASADFTMNDMDNGWYHLHIGGELRELSYIDIDATGNAVVSSLRNTKFYLQKIRNAPDARVEVTLQMADGRYLGVSEKETSGTRLKAVSIPYSWLIDINYALRPKADDKYVVYASGDSLKDGTPVVLNQYHYTPAYGEIWFEDWDREITYGDAAYIIDCVYDVSNLYITGKEKHLYMKYYNYGGDVGKYRLVDTGLVNEAKINWNSVITYGEL